MAAARCVPRPTKKKPSKGKAKKKAAKPEKGAGKGAKGAKGAKDVKKKKTVAKKKAVTKKKLTCEPPKSKARTPSGGTKPKSLTTMQMRTAQSEPWAVPQSGYAPTVHRQRRLRTNLQRQVSHRHDVRDGASNLLHYIHGSAQHDLVVHRDDEVVL